MQGENHLILFRTGSYGSPFMPAVKSRFMAGCFYIFTLLIFCFRSLKIRIAVTGYVIMLENSRLFREI